MRSQRILILTALAVALLPASAAAAHQRAPSVWLTTGDRAHLLEKQPRSALGPADPSLPTITVDPSQRYQRIAGFGASITDSSASLLAPLPGRDRLMRELFDPRRGIGLSYLRQPIGASDFTNGPHYTYDDLPPGQTDYGMDRFSIAHDRAQILPLLRQARRLNRRLKVMGTPWSPPAWMKQNGSLVGGRIIDDDRIYRSLAKYFVKFVRAYEREGVPIDALTPQNEPQNRFPFEYPGMDLRPNEEAKLVIEMGRALRAAGYDTKILGYDHNWSLHPNDVGLPGADPEYARTLLSDPLAYRYLDGIAYHCYSGDPARQSELHADFPRKDIYFTECSGVESGDPSATFADTLHWHTMMLTVWSVRHWAKSVIAWNLALDPSHGPHNGGCDTCTGVVTVDPATGGVTREGDYYALGHASKFVRPGAVRIGSNVAGTIQDVAFRNRDGSIVVVAVNDDWSHSGSQKFTLKMGRRSFSYDLPAGGVATFRMRH